MLMLGALLLAAAPAVEGYRYRIGVTVVAVLALALTLVWIAPGWGGRDKGAATALVLGGLLVTGAVMVHQEWAGNPCRFMSRYFPGPATASPLDVPRICPGLPDSPTPVHQAVKPFMAVFPAGAALLLAARRADR